MNADLIQNHMKKVKSTTAYAILAQPLDEMLPPFVLQLFGTNNTFQAKDVLNRWETTERELAKYGIKVAGYFSDANGRLLSVMCYETLFKYCDKVTVQNSIHIATKLRNRLLNSKISLQMGTLKISIEHVKAMIKNVPKDVLCMD